MELRIKEARLNAGLSQLELSERMQVSHQSVNTWELGTRMISIDKLQQMAKILGCTCAYLLGEDCHTELMRPLNYKMLFTMNCSPVWAKERGWGLVDVPNKQIVFLNENPLPFADAVSDLYYIPPAFSIGMAGIGSPLEPEDLISRKKVWVEPISSDTKLSSELRGWYHLHDNRLVQNEYGTRFYLDTYGAKWLAFADCINRGSDK